MTSQKINPKVVWVAALGGFITLLAPSLVEHLQQWESGKARVLVVYPDKLANNIPTVCNGLTRHVTRTPIIVGERWSEEKCVVEEANAIERVQRGWRAWLFPGWGSPEPSWLRTHPATEERVRRLLELARRIPPPGHDAGAPPSFPPPSSSAPRYRPGSGLWY